MKCPECNGTGKVVKYFYERIKANDYRKVCGDVTCEDCGGTGYIEQTNEEWFCGLSTEEKAKFFDKICYSAWSDVNSRFRDMADYTDWEVWLKEKHNAE